MRYIDQWLSGLGLDHVIPLLQTHGITTPKKLALLTLRDIYEVGKHLKDQRTESNSVHVLYLCC